MHYKKLTALILALFCSLPSNAKSTQPKLVLQITVDGLRGDLLQRYQHNFAQGGFNYLMKNGVSYTNAHYQHGNTETIVGHVSLATGAPPSVHGMVGNVWYDQTAKRLVYNVEDGNYTMLTSGAGVDKSTEIDPTQKTALKDGRSPTPILSTTFSDELSLSTNGQSKVFAVSVKDRGAISLAGHTGKAFWFSKSQAEFVTSNYYYDAYPSWVNHWNNQHIAKQYDQTTWTLSLPKERYSLPEQSHAHKVDLAGFGKTFPHMYGSSDGKYYNTMLTLSPAGDELTENFASTLLEKENLGKSNVTDYLSVSFSSNDYVIHVFGSQALETEDNLIRLDRTIAKLLKSVDKQVGLHNTLIVLSADHGVPESSPVAHDLGLEHAHYFTKDTLLSKNVEQRLKDEFGLDKNAIRLYAQPYIYLNRELIASKKLNLATVQKAIAEEVSKVEGVALAYSSSDIATNQVPDSRVTKLIKNNYHPTRSGDVYIVYSPRSYINDMDGLTIASTHGSPWRYDTHVPIIFVGNGIQAKEVSRIVTPYDIAPTLSNALSITHPSGSIGNVLQEVTTR